MQTNTIKRLILIPLIFFAACSEFLDEKPDKRLAELATVEDLQAILNEASLINFGGSEGEIGAGDFYLLDDDWAASRESIRQLYLWEDAGLSDLTGDNGWTLGYRIMYHCNTVLERAAHLEVGADDREAFNNVKGQAFFHRAHALWDVATIFAEGYAVEDAERTPGLPLRLNTDFNVKSERPSLKLTYEQIVSDLNQSIAFLPEKQPTKWWPSKAAAHALMARVSLYINDVEGAWNHADSCLKLQGTLMDYNALDQNASYPFRDEPTVDDEILFSKYVLNHSIFFPSSTQLSVSDDLLNLYHQDDIRKDVLFRDNMDGTYGFRGSYLGSNGYFMGLATDEIYLIRAEAAARLNRLDEAVADLNTLLSNRWRDGTSLPLTRDTDILERILEERRKELLFRCLRWSDLKRLNKGGANITLERTIDGQTYVLPANDPKYAVMIPDNVISISGMKQNRQ